MMTITLSGDTEDRVRDEARKRGVEAADYAIQLLEHGLAEQPAANGADPTVAFLLRRRQEQATTDPAELERRRRMTEELLRSLDRHPVDAG